MQDVGRVWPTGSFLQHNRSGHPSRLDRPTLNESYRFGDISYAKEELRAELASVFLAAERGIPHDPEQHAAYASSWINVLKQDKNEIFRAAHDASRAADFLLALERDRSIAGRILQDEPVLDSAELRVLPDMVLERDRENREAGPAPSGYSAELTIRGTPAPVKSREPGRSR
jgi:hypothetical protein